jgi:hypothetical protein
MRIRFIQFFYGKSDKGLIFQRRYIISIYLLR